MADPIVVVDHDPGWPDRYEALRRQIVSALADLRFEIEHVGSTAIPGLPAKPVIDLDVSLADADDMPAAIARLAAIGYVHEGDLGVPGREAFATPPGYGKHDHHLYVCVPGCAAHAEHVAFRDYLLVHPAAAQAYGELKRSLAARHRHDRAGYTNGKTDFVRRILASASGDRA